MADVSTDVPGLPPGIGQLASAIHPVYGGIIIVGAWCAVQALRALFQYLKEKPLSQKALIEAKEISSTKANELLEREATRLTAIIDSESKRHLAELARLDARLESKATMINHLEQIVSRLSTDRDRGWDLAREVNDELLTFKHEANNRLQVAYSAGKLGLTLPEPFPDFPPLVSRKGKRAGEYNDERTFNSADSRS